MKIHALVLLAILSGTSIGGSAKADEVHIKKQIERTKSCVRSPCYKSEDNRFKKAVKKELKNDLKETCYRDYRKAKKIRIEVNCRTIRSGHRGWPQIHCKGFGTAECKD